jgi:hypothetical protein
MNYTEHEPRLADRFMAEWKASCKPQRIQRRRTKGWKMPEGAVYVGRPTRFGNPCKVGMFHNYSAENAIRDFKAYIERDPMVRSFEISFGPPPSIAYIQEQLRGKDLACWCPLDHPCHADVLLEIANS